MVKKRIKVFRDEQTIEVEGVKYRAKYEKFKKIDNVEHSAYVVYEEIIEKEQKKKLDFIKGKLIKKVPTDLVLREILKGMFSKDIDRLYNILKKKKPKIKKHDGCLGISIDGGKRNRMYLDIFE